MKLYSDEFADDPHGAYLAMRREQGALVPVELAPGVPATLVVGYREALQILSDSSHFAIDPAPAATENPVQSQRIVASKGGDPARYRHAYTSSLEQVDLYSLRDRVGATAVPLINRFCESGTADLMAQYALPLTIDMFDALLGFTQTTGDKVFTALIDLELAENPEEAESANDLLTSEIQNVITAKRIAPGADVISRLIADPAGYDEAELVGLTAKIYGSGIEPTCNLIANTLLSLVTDDQLNGGVFGGALSTQDAIDAVLFADPPLANSCVRYPHQPQIVGETWLPAHQPVVISLAACNNDMGAVGGDRTRNRSHLAWGAGPHACAAQSIARVIVAEALDQLLDAVPELALAVAVEELQWQPGGTHRSLAALPVTFTPSPPLNVM